MRRIMGWLLGLSFACALLPPAVLAVPILDQEFDPANKNVPLAIGSVNANPAQNLDGGQTFTVGITGILTSVDLMVGRDDPMTTGDLLFDIRTTVGGAPTEPNSGGNILVSLSIPAATFPVDSIPTSFASIDLSGLGVSVMSGDVLAIALRSLGENPAYFWTGSSTDNYADGSAYRRFLSPSWEVPTFANDFAFRTFVDPSAAAVPEPATLALLGLGLAGFGFARRRRLHG